MNIQAVNAYTSQIGSAGGATQDVSTTELAQQPAVSGDSLGQLAGHSVDQDPEPGAGTDQSATDEAPLAGYTADAQRAGRIGAPGTISILA